MKKKKIVKAHKVAKKMLKGKSGEYMQKKYGEKAEEVAYATAMKQQKNESLDLKQHYKKILLEAAEKRFKRIDKAIASAQNRLMSDAGFEPDASGSYDPIDVADTMDAMGDHPDVKKLDTLQDVYADAFGKKIKRETQIADQLKERNPELYTKYYTQEKPKIFAQHTDMINNAHQRLQTLRNLNAPEKLIKAEQDRLDTMSTRLHGLVHSAVANAHKNAMEALYKP